MGQYYRAIVKKKSGRCIVYNRNILRDGKTEYMVAKLTEHSWWLNEFVNAVCLDVYKRKEKNRIAWIGDYAKSFLTHINAQSFNGLNDKQIKELTDKCWNCTGNAVTPNDFTLDDLFLVNHTKQEYIDCSAYYRNSVMGDGWCLHPLPILTCIGNGLGCGDYNYPTAASTSEFVGYWAWDEISIEDKPITNYTPLLPIFKEEGWD